MEALPRRRWRIAAALACAFGALAWGGAPRVDARDDGPGGRSGHDGRDGGAGRAERGAGGHELRAGTLRPSPGWHGPIDRFHEHDWDIWRRGHWQNGPHDGRLGWWWIIGDSWYYYPSPVYPVPNPYEPPPVEFAAPSPDNPPPLYWYFCQDAAGYYPYVASCPGGWTRVPAAPAAPAAPVAPADATPAN